MHAYEEIENDFQCLIKYTCEDLEKVDGRLEAAQSLQLFELSLHLLSRLLLLFPFVRYHESEQV